jgi:hypothetical protein
MAKSEVDVQEVFHKVIEVGFYAKDGAEDLMCLALDDAVFRKVISRKQCLSSLQQIKDYIGDMIFLDDVLHDNNLPSDFNARLSIYRDWANRPKLKQFEESL